VSENKLKSVHIWQSYKQERGCLVHFARLANILLNDEESARDNHSHNCENDAESHRNQKEQNDSDDDATRRCPHAKPRCIRPGHDAIRSRDAAKNTNVSSVMRAKQCSQQQTNGTELQF